MGTHLFHLLDTNDSDSNNSSEGFVGGSFGR